MKLDYIAPEKRYGDTLADHAAFFRKIAPEVEINPDAIFQYIEHPAFDLLSDDRTSNAIDRYHVYEAFGYGDTNVLFASPRTCLTGILLKAIGHQEHQDLYFSLMKTKLYRSFFACTERHVGSDASQIRATMKKQDSTITLQGEKMLFGNAASGQLGIVLAKEADNALGIRAILLLPNDIKNQTERIEREDFPMFGIPAAMLGRMQLNNIDVPQSRLVGQHLKPSRRSLISIVQTFNEMRMGIAGLALGHTQSVLDYLYLHKNDLTRHESHLIKSWQDKLDTIRHYCHHALNQHLKNPYHTASISIAKVSASQLAEEVAKNAITFFPTVDLLQHPFLLLRYRDAYGYEFMDGTRDIQYKNAFYGVNDHDF